MTRKEEIKIAAVDYVRLSNRICPDEQSFFDGAEWADSHPQSDEYNTNKESNYHLITENNIEKESELYAQDVIGEFFQNIRHLFRNCLHCRRKSMK